jgi:ankyrin repeat protein
MPSGDIYKAVKAGDVARVRQLIAEDPALIHARDGDQSTPLHWAAWKGHAEVIEALLDGGADIQAHNTNYHWGTTPLHAAAHGNQKAAVDTLIRRGADINALKANGAGTPLAETKVHNATAAAKLLRAAGAAE